MRKKTTLMGLLVAVAFAFAGLAVWHAIAQKPDEGEGEGPPPPRFEGRPVFRPPMPPMPVAITANADYVYVVRGNMLYQFGAKDLKPINKVMLEEAPMPGGPPGRPGRPLRGRPPRRDEGEGKEQ